MRSVTLHPTLHYSAARGFRVDRGAADDPDVPDFYVGEYRPRLADRLYEIVGADGPIEVG